MSAMHKIIFTGPVGAGKTTAIASMSDAPPLQTEAVASDETADRKDSTTVAMDYGTLALDNGAVLHLYGTPGQDRFDFMWEILVEGGFGLVLLVDNVAEDPVGDMASYLTAFEKFIDETAVVVGVTRMDVSHKPCLEDYNRKLQELGMVIPVFEVDAREPNDVRALLMALLVTLDPLVGRNDVHAGARV